MLVYLLSIRVTLLPAIIVTSHHSYLFTHIDLKKLIVISFTILNCKLFFYFVMRVWASYYGTLAIGVSKLLLIKIFNTFWFHSLEPVPRTKLNYIPDQTWSDFRVKFVC